jgi:hypothetical protein
MYGKLKLTVLFILIFLSQNVAGQDLERYFIEYLEEGNVDRITEVIDLGLDVNNAQIKKKSVLDYVFDNSEDASITMSVLDVLVEAGVNLNNYPIRFRKILDDRDTIFIDYFLSNGFSATSINIPNQNSLSTTYLKYLKEKGFKINDDIIKKRELNLDIVNFRNYLKTRNTKSVIKELEKPFMDNLRLNHMDLFYAIKTLDTIVINKVL